MALTFVQLAREKGVGISKLITVGNAADLRIPEYLEYLQADPDTRAIVAYLEGFEPGEGRAIWELMRRLPNPKPVVVVKPGETDSGRRAALSHTGALAGQHRVVAAALRQCGIQRVADSEEAWDVAMALALLPAPEPGAVVVISDGGGHATIVADTADKAGLAVPPLSSAIQEALASVLPPRSGYPEPGRLRGSGRGGAGSGTPRARHRARRSRDRRRADRRALRRVFQDRHRGAGAPRVRGGDGARAGRRAPGQARDRRTPSTERSAWPRSSPCARRASRSIARSRPRPGRWARFGVTPTACRRRGPATRRSRPDAAQVTALLEGYA